MIGMETQRLNKSEEQANVKTHFIGRYLYIKGNFFLNSALKYPIKKKD